MPYDALKKQLRSLLLRLNSMLNTVLERAPDALRKQVEDYKLAARMHLLKGTIKEEALIDKEAIEREYRRAWRLLGEAADGKAPGDFLEFGTYYGASLSTMHRVLEEQGLDDVRLFGFDSFEGLPETADDEGPWRPGEFTADYQGARRYLTAQGVDWDRVVLTKGWFGDTLTDEFKKKHALTKASVIMVDCDIYSSAKQALDFCASLVEDEAIFFFDDWHSSGLAERDMGEKRAFEEFLGEHPRLSAEAVGTYSFKEHPNGKIFHVSSTAVSAPPTSH